MPELPEVETVVRGLRPVLEGRVIVSTDLGPKPLRFPYPDGLVEALQGKRILTVARRAKYILISLEGGATLLWHLGMTGRFSVQAQGEQPQRLSEFYDGVASEQAAAGTHDHVRLALDEGTVLTYSDPRRFGIVDLIHGVTDAHKLLRDIGPEPLGNGFNADHLAAAFKGQKAPLKAALLDQSVVAGLGNIYVSEILHRSGLKPERSAGTLSGKKVKRDKLEEMVRHTRAVLEEAITAGGSTLRDFAHTDGTSGDFQQRFMVYDREGQGCLKPACGGHIKRIVQSGRSSFYCSKCQV